MRRRHDRLAGLYIHVPFCARRCPYCDFAVTVQRDEPHTAYADALLAELEARRGDLEGRVLRTVYLGGGTPSRWSLEAFGRTMTGVSRRVNLAAVEEVTLEANPIDVTRESLEAWKAAGVTRVSIGVQSFVPSVLRALNRNHSAEQARRAVELALTSGIRSVSLDLIFGVPEQTREDWRADLREVERFEGLSHLSAYHLTVEPGTAFWRRQRRGRLGLPDEEEAYGMLAELGSAAEAMGMERYEVSNYAREGERSRHNTAYWLGAEYVGLGMGAHSLRIDAGGVFRRVNRGELSAYLVDPTGAEEEERVAPHAHLLERLYLGLRTREGIDWSSVVEQFAGVVDDASLRASRAQLERFVTHGYVEREGGQVYRPTWRGLDVADALAGEILSRA